MVEKSLSDAKLTLMLAVLGFTTLTGLPPPVGVKVSPVIVVRNDRTSHKGASPTKANTVPLPATGGLLYPPQLVKKAAAKPVIRLTTSIRLGIHLSLWLPLVLDT